MTALAKMPLSKQETDIYNLLLEKQLLSAQEVAVRLGILPNAVYRTAHSLVDTGLIEKTNTYPVKFQARPIDKAIESYLLLSRNNFLERFQKVERNNKKQKNKDQKLSVSFIKTRSELLAMTNTDMKNVKKSIDHIVSGIELPAETMLSFKKAIDRGVKVRFLIQNLNELNHEMISNWLRTGLEVRYSPLLEARIIIFDSETVYLTSYNPQNKEEATGVRFAYPPIANQLKGLFEQRWKNSKPITKKWLTKAI